MNDRNRCRAVTTSEPSCIPYLNVLLQKMSFGWHLELERVFDTLQPMQLQQGLRRHVHFQCSMHWRAVTLYPALLAMGRRLHGLWTVFPELTHGLLKLSSAPDDIPQEVMAMTERFVILLFDRTSPCTEIDTARRKLFVKRHNVLSIPPTKAALEEHLKRAV